MSIKFEEVYVSYDSFGCSSECKMELEWEKVSDTYTLYLDESEIVVLDREDLRALNKLIKKANV